MDLYQRVLSCECSHIDTWGREAQKFRRILGQSKTSSIKYDTRDLVQGKVIKKKKSI